MSEHTTAEVPGDCTCTWALRPDDRRWQRIGEPKEDCPRCTDNPVPRPPRRDPHDYPYPPEWLDDRGP